MIRKLILILVGLLLITSLGTCQDNRSIETIMKNEYPKLVLLTFAKGNFTGSKSEEYIAFYEDPKERVEKDSPVVIAKVVIFVLKNSTITSVYDLENLNIWSLDYSERYLKIIKNPQLQFGRWSGYAYIGDYNGNGLEEILFFELSGRSFLPTIVEFNGKEFGTVLSFQTYTERLSEIWTENRNGRKLLKLYGYGDENTPKDKRDWYLYEWSKATKSYKIIEKGIE